MPRLFQNHSTSVWFDFTGNDLVVCRKEAKNLPISKTIPFNLEITSEFLGLEQSRNIRNAPLKLPRFQRLLPLMALEHNMARLLWEAFFRDASIELSSWLKSDDIVFLVPTAWEPQISDTLIKGFCSVFGAIPVQICTEAFAVLFCGLSRLRSETISRPYIGEKKLRVCAPKQEKSKGRNYYDYLVMTDQDSLVVQLLGWGFESSSELHEPNLLWAEVASCNGYTFASQGYLQLMDYLEQPLLPRIDLEVDLTICVALDQNRLLPVIGPDCFFGQWYGRKFSLVQTVEYLKVTLVAHLAENKENIFPLATIQLARKEGHPFSDEGIITVQLKRLHYGKVLGKLKYSQGEESHESKTEVLLPRLYH
jgi:hypothetical protein